MICVILLNKKQYMYIKFINFTNLIREIISLTMFFFTHLQDVLQMFLVKGLDINSWGVKKAQTRGTTWTPELGRIT